MKIVVKLDKRKSGLTREGYPIVIYIKKPHQPGRPFRTGLFSQPQHWNDRLAQATAKHPDHYYINDFLNIKKRRITDVLLMASRTPLTIDEAYRQIEQRQFDSFFKSGMALINHNSSNTKYWALQKFNAHYPNIKIDEVNQSMVSEFKSALLRNGHKPAGVDSYLRSLRAIWNKTSRHPNPFKGVSVPIPKKINRVSTIGDLRKLKAADLSDRGNIGGLDHYRDYWLAMFFLGGVDPEVIAKLRYDLHVVSDRVQFNRNKGGSKMPCNNLIVPELKAILKKYEGGDFLFPIHQSASYHTFMKNFQPGLKELSSALQLSVAIHPKSARYTFIHRAQELFIDERLTAQIVGHKRKTTTSLYTNDYPLSVQDEAHIKIIHING